MSERLNIGVACHHGSGKRSHYAGLARDLTEQCLRMVDHKRLSVRGLLLLSTADWCSPSDSLSKHIRREFERCLGYPVPLIGTSVAAAFCSTDPKPFIQKGLTLVALCSDDIWMTVGALSRPYSGTNRSRQQRLRTMAVRLEKAAGWRLGTSAQRELLGFLPGVFLDAAGQQVYHDNEFHGEILKAFDYRYRLFGGAAADDIVPKKGYQFANDECLESGLAVAIVESDLSAGEATGHGIVPSRQPPLSVDRLVGNAKSGYDVALLDGIPATERLQKLADEVLGEDGSIIFGIPCGPDFDILVPLDIYQCKGGSIRLNRRISRGDRIYLMGATPDQMVKVSVGLLKRVQENANSPDVVDLGLILGFSCTGRFELYRKQNVPWKEAVERVRKNYPGVPIIAGLCAGEFGVDAWHRARANNMSVSLCCLTGMLCRRARTRELQEALLLAADRVSMCKSPQEVMETALKGAVDAGAQGGQICVVDWTIGRIVGKHLGCAYQAQGSSHNWSAVLELTDREAPDNPVACYGDLSPALKEWAVWLKPPVPDLGPCNSLKSKDILTLIIRCGVALFVPDSRDPKFLCEQTAVDACVGPRPKTLVYFAIPLIGSNGRAIATLQVGFPDGTILDREAMRLWVGYGQKVGAALERTQDAEELAIKDAVSAEASRISEKPVDTRVQWHEWCEEMCQPFVKTVRNELRASGTHMRIRYEGLVGDEYSLVAGDGDLDVLRRITRPVIQAGAGSLKAGSLGKEGQITNTKEQTKKLNEGVVSLTGDASSRMGFVRQLNEIECTAMLPLYDERKRLLGSFVIDSKQRYFFTERRARIAHFIAEIAETMVRDRRMAYDRAILEEEQDRIITTLAATTGSDADRSLRKIAECLCNATGANVGSIYVWYESARKLVLHVAHNWHCQQEMEGKAWYGLGEGWTGSVGLVNSFSGPVKIVDPTLGSVPLCTRKYYNQMVAREHHAPKGRGDSRVAIRLAVNKNIVGVVTLTYWRESSKTLVRDRDRVKKFAEALAPLITLAVEVAQQENSRREIAELVEAEKATAEIVIQAARPDGDWQAVVDIIRERFQVERVTFYDFDGQKLYHHASSVGRGVIFASPFGGPMEPTGPMREVVFRRSDVTIGPGSPHLLDQWPSLMGAKGVFLAPALCTLGDVRGVLEFVNRTADRDHPFEIFDDYEQAVARDVARVVGTGLDHRGHEIAERELRTQTMTAMKIGAASITSVIVMHRVMAPFARIQQAIEWLRLNPEKSGHERVARLDRVQNACAEAIKTINEAAGPGTLVARHESLRTIVGQAIRVIRPDIPITGVKLEIRNAVDAPVFVDVVSIIGAVVNLLSNAIDAIGESGVLEATTELTDDGKAGIIRIRNTGSRVEPEEIAQFFRPGYTLKAKEGHLGLGLSVARHAIEMAGGTMEMIPRPEGGVELIVTLPIANDSGPREQVLGKH